MKITNLFNTKDSEKSLKDTLNALLEFDISEKRLEVMINGNMDEDRRSALGGAIIEAVYCVQYMISSIGYYDNGDMDGAKKDAVVSDEHFSEMKRALLSFVEE